MMERSSRMRTMRGFFTGVSLSLDSAVLLTSTKGYRKFLVLPFVLNIMILVSLVVLAVSAAYPLIMSLLPSGEQWYLILLRGFAVPCVVLFLAGVIAILYSLAGCIVAVPFADAVVTKILAGKGGAGGGLFAAAASAVHGILMLAVFLCSSLLLSIFNVIPVVGNLFYVIMSFFLLLFFLGSQVYDMTSSGGRKGFLAKMSSYWSLRWCMCGIGFSFLVFSAIPVFGFLAPIISAAAAARLRYALLSEGEDAA